MPKKHKSRQVSKKTYARIRLLSAAALVFCAVMAIVVDASDQSKAKPAVSAPASKASSSAVSPAASKPSTAASKPGVAAVQDTTYVGCLREDDAKFVLTEIGGPDAPKSRNWKTGFMTKKAGKLEVTSAGTLRLSPYVNQTVQIAGKRVDNTVAARSVKVIGSTCD